jgi:hypothetical protein
VNQSVLNFENTLRIAIFASGEEELVPAVKVFPIEQGNPAVLIGLGG